MDWTIILDSIAQAGTALAPIIATVVMLIVGTLFYRLTGLLPGFVRAYVEKAYRDREAMFRDAITKAITTGVAAAARRGKRGQDVLQMAVDHAMRSNPKNVAYNDLFNVCEHYFGQPRQSGTSHAVFKMPWAGDPRVNIQNDKGKAKAYQVRQVLAAIDKKEAM